jgi:hypothetical protein
LRFEAKNPAMYHELNGEDLISFYAKANKLRPRMSPHFTGAPVHCAEPGGGRSAESNLIQFNSEIQEFMQATSVQIKIRLCQRPFGAKLMWL